MYGLVTNFTLQDRWGRVISLQAQVRGLPTHSSCTLRYEHTVVRLVGPNTALAAKQERTIEVIGRV